MIQKVAIEVQGVSKANDPEASLRQGSSTPVILKVSSLQRTLKDIENS